MNRQEQVEYLIEILLQEMPQCRAQAAYVGADGRRQLLRGLMNIREPRPLREDFLRVQDELLSAEREERGVVDAENLPPVAADARLTLWQGDITRLRCGAIVNAANSALLGCFHPCHNCIDNVIHSAAGLQLRDECSRIMQKQGRPEPVGQAKRTGGYNLPCRYVLHTVGPMISGPLQSADCEALARCYRSCLEQAEQAQAGSVAFCCISTGEFRFPHEKAAEIAVLAVQDYLNQTNSEMRVIFNVFQDRDYRVYRRLLGPDCPAGQSGARG